MAEKIELGDGSHHEEEEEDSSHEEEDNHDDSGGGFLGLGDGSSSKPSNPNKRDPDDMDIPKYDDRNFSDEDDLEDEIISSMPDFPDVDGETEQERTKRLELYTYRYIRKYIKRRKGRKWWVKYGSSDRKIGIFESIPILIKSIYYRFFAPIEKRFVRDLKSYKSLIPEDVRKTVGDFWVTEVKYKYPDRDRRNRIVEGTIKLNFFDQLEIATSKLVDLGIDELSRTITRLDDWLLLSLHNLIVSSPFLCLCL